MSNSVDSTSQQYNDHLPQWTRIRDAIKGQDCIHEKGEDYLPKLSGQETDSYNKYKGQALFYNASGRTFTTYKGLIFRKEPDINADSIPDVVEDCDNAGTPLEQFAEVVVEEELKTSRFGILVDYPNMENRNLSQAEAQRQGLRPYLTGYKAEKILETKTKRIGNKTVLYRVRLKETHEEPTDDEFKNEHIEQVRVLDLEDDMIYRQRVFRKEGENKTKWVEVEDLRQYPKMNGKKITEIPFFMPGGYDYRTPHMVDLVNVNLSHYVAYADHRKGIAWTTRPQPYATGLRNDEHDTLTMGDEGLWISQSSEAKFGMLEYSGTGLKASENALDKLEEMMANIGARMLMPEVGGEADTATEFVIKKQGENSSLANVSKMVGQCITKALKFVAEWMGQNPDDIEISLNTDFIPFQATPDDLIKMIQAVQSGKYSEADYMWWLQQAELKDPTISDEDRLSQMQTTPPAGMGGNLNGGM